MGYLKERVNKVHRLSDKNLDDRVKYCEVY